MRVLVAHSFYRVAGGENRLVRDQVDWLRSIGHEVKLLERQNVDLAPGLGTATRMTYSRQATAEVCNLIDEFHPDIVHVHNVYPSFGPAIHLGCRRNGIPIVMSVHNYRLRCPNSYMFTEGRPCKRCQSGLYFNAVVHHCFPTRSQAAGYAAALWSHRFVMRLERDVSVFVAPSLFVRDRMVHEWGFPGERVEVVRHPVAQALEGKLPPGGYGLYMGRLSPEKGVHFLLEALAIAGDPPFKLFGEGPQHRELVDQASRLGLKNTEFLGFVEKDELSANLGGARFVVVPSLAEETSSLAASEALGAGRPLIVTSAGALPELAGEGRGLVCRPADPAGLAQAIEKVFGDEQLCRLMSGRGLDFVHSELTVASHLSALERCYRKAVTP